MNFRRVSMGAAVLAGAFALTSTATNAVTFYVANPTSNLANWTSAVIAAGGSVTTNIDFDAPSTGATYTTTGSVGISSGNGPGDGNNGSPTLSIGEGPNPASNYLRVNSPYFRDFRVNLPRYRGLSSVTVNYTAPVAAAGFFTIDYFGASGFNNLLNLSVYDGANGTGALLGSATSVYFNFQNNNRYFMGVTSATANIGSIVFSRTFDNTGDNIGLDNFVSSRTGAVPEPASWAMLIAGFGLTGAVMRRRRSVIA